VTFKYLGVQVKFGDRLIYCPRCQSNDVVERDDQQSHFNQSIFWVLFMCLGCGEQFQVVDQTA